MHSFGIRTNRIARRRFLSVLLASTALSASFFANAGTAFAQQVIDGSTETVIGTGGGTQPSPWNIADDLTVGGAGTGDLKISEGGEVSNVDGIVGNDAGSVGTVTITDSGSAWINADDLTVGFSGTGILDISLVFSTFPMEARLAMTEALSVTISAPTARLR